MARTLADMRGAVVRNLGGEMTDEYLNVSNVVLTSVINECLAAIDAEADWPWNMASEVITTVSGTHLYTPGDSLWTRTRSIVDPDNGPLSFLSVEHMAQSWPDPTDTGGTGGAVLWYTEAAGQLDLRPTPGGAFALTHLYSRAEPELIDDGDEPLLPDRFRPRLIDMATAEAASRLRLWAVQQRYQVKDAGHAKRMQDDRRRTKARSGIRTRPGTWPT